MKRLLSLTLALPLLALLGCGPSPAQVVAKHQPAYATLRQKLTDYQGNLPAVGSVVDQPPAKPLAVPLVLSSRSVSGNAEALMIEELFGEKPEFDLNLSQNLATGLHWTGEATAPKQGDPAFMEKTLAAGAAVKYLIVHRVADLQLPEAIGNDLFKPGHIVVEGFVFDTATDEIVATYVAQAKTNDSVRFEYKEGESQDAALARFARSTVWSNVRSEIARKIETVVGGQVTIED